MWTWMERAERASPSLGWEGMVPAWVLIVRVVLKPGMVGKRRQRVKGVQKGRKRDSGGRGKVRTRYVLR